MGGSNARLHADGELSTAAMRGMRIECTAALSDGIGDVGELLGQLMSQPGYLNSRRWRIGCRLMARLEREWPPTLEDEREVMLLLERTKQFLNRPR